MVHVLLGNRELGFLQFLFGQVTLCAVSIGWLLQKGEGSVRSLAE